MKSLLFFLMILLVLTGAYNDWGQMLVHIGLLSFEHPYY